MKVLKHCVSLEYSPLLAIGILKVYKIKCAHFVAMLYILPFGHFSMNDFAVPQVFGYELWVTVFARK